MSTISAVTHTYFYRSERRKRDLRKLNVSITHQAHILPFPWKHEQFESSAAQKQHLSSLCHHQNFAISSLSRRMRCRFICAWQRQAAGDYTDVCQREFHSPVSPVLCSHCWPSLLTINTNWRGRTKAVRQSMHCALRGHPLLGRVLLCWVCYSCCRTAVFPVLRPTACQRAQRPVAQPCYLQGPWLRMLAAYIKSTYSLEQSVSWITLFIIKK